MAARMPNERPLRTGYTTGACAAAAVKAAAMALLEQNMIRQVEISLPGGQQAAFAIRNCAFDSGMAMCSVTKDAGDDPDVTNGAEIWASVCRDDGPGIAIRGGRGVGLVTRPGLEVAVGMPAINPVPRQMILESVREVVKDGRRVMVTISVPAGEELAKHTLNARLGITGGISILGTTGIVVPFSVNAYTTCISQALDVAVASGCRQVVLTTGRRSERFAQRALGLSDECFIQAGDFIGFSLGECAVRPLAKVTIWGMAGKMSKIAAGDLNTNVSHSRIDFDFLTRLARSCGVPEEVLATLAGSVTAHHFQQLLPPVYRPLFGNELCALAARVGREITGGKAEIECIMSDYEGVIQGRASA